MSSYAPRKGAYQSLVSAMLLNILPNKVGQIHLGDLDVGPWRLDDVFLLLHIDLLTSSSSLNLTMYFSSFILMSNFLNILCQFPLIVHPHCFCVNYKLNYKRLVLVVVRENKV